MARSESTIIKKRFEKLAEEIGKMLYYQMLITKYEIAKERGKVKRLNNIDELFE